VGDLVPAFLAGIAAADECLVVELNGRPPQSRCVSEPAAQGSSHGAETWGERALTVIRREFAALRSVRHLARRLRCHPVYLARAFREALDVPVSDYLAAFKVGVAFRLLTETELKICAIPDVVGFGGKATLYRHVHRLTGHAPGYWRLVRHRVESADASQHWRVEPPDRSAQAAGKSQAPMVPGLVPNVNAAPRQLTAPMLRMTLADNLAARSLAAGRPVSAYGHGGVRAPDGAGLDPYAAWAWTLPRPVATLMGPLSMYDPPS
jgi:methylphosphotriester-DNA--protein-cysteine methyltransferase